MNKRGLKRVSYETSIQDMVSSSAMIQLVPLHTPRYEFFIKSQFLHRI